MGLPKMPEMPKMPKMPKKNCVKLGLIDLPKFGGGGLSPTPALPYPLSSYLVLIIVKLGLSL